MSPGWLSNSWLAAGGPGGPAVLIDSGGPVQGIEDAVRRFDLSLTHVLCTHHHHDHVAHNRHYREVHGAAVAAHPAENASMPEPADLELHDGDVVEAGSLRVVARHIPGHTVGQLAFVVEGECVFTGDTLFRGSVGGTRGPGHATYEDLVRSIMDVLMRLPHELAVHPGHTESTTIGHEWERNPFVRMWRGIDPPAAEPCIALGEPATLLLWARDYDGGGKCIVRFADGRHDVVPGSRVERRP